MASTQYHRISRGCRRRGGRRSGHRGRRRRNRQRRNLRWPTRPTPRPREDGDRCPTAPKPLEKLTDRIEKVATHGDEGGYGVQAQAVDRRRFVGFEARATRESPPRRSPFKKPKPTAKEFEAQQVERLKGLFQPREAAAPCGGQGRTATSSPRPMRKGSRTRSAPMIRTPVDVPDAVVAVRDQLAGAAPEALAPYVREGVEQAYRGSQMIPWVNAVVPITKIVPLIGPATGEGPAALDARQVIVNELIKTTPPGSFLYYGYDLVADLANREEAAADLKEQAFAGVWDLLDFGNFAHNDGESGIGNAPGRLALSARRSSAP